MEVPPPGAGVTTVTWNVPSVSTGIVAVIPVVAINVVVSGMVLEPEVQLTTEQGSKLLPFTSRGSTEPAV